MFDTTRGYPERWAHGLQGKHLMQYPDGNPPQALQWLVPSYGNVKEARHPVGNEQQMEVQTKSKNIA